MTQKENIELSENSRYQATKIADWESKGVEIVKSPS
jgi:hypothetical protein